MGGGDDTISSMAGNDRIADGKGNDTLNGGTGNDSYIVKLGDGADVANENDTTVGNSDTIRFGTEIASDQVWFGRSGSNLVTSIVGTEGKVAITNWYSGSAYQTERFQLASGAALLNSGGAIG